ncbi:MAG: DUF3833 domain-containing protein [SAR116 cluster bacterium]|mgnify:FL=1|nr:MAG: DUF3833 domain-containing protein [SAR116 cluster bacterium]|tara:strand:- start:1279 stop:1905 length:627 start_codon:yes stop_codon:yes gene_type:complete
MKRKTSLFSRLGQLVLAMALLSGLSVGISACARNNITTLADRAPKLDLQTFFAGQTVALGIFEDRFGNLRRQFRVVLEGTVDGDVLTLDETFLYDDGEQDFRKWVIRRTGKGKDGEVLYEGSAEDIMGVASGAVSGNALNWEYDVVLSIDGRDVEVHFDDWIYQQHEDVAINRAYVSKFGIEIGSVTIVFLRGDAADAISPLDLKRWS